MSPSLPRVVLAAIFVSSVSSLAPVSAQAAGGKTAVDVELVLAVDISYSMDEKEQRLQRAGYVAALRSPEFLDAIKSGPLGRIAIEYIQWASSNDQNKLLDWTMVDNADSAKTVADRLSAAPYRRARRTSISGGVDAAMRDLQSDPFVGARRIIDMSGDGPNNDGRPVTDARDDATLKGVTINGLPLVGIRPYLGPADIPNLDIYYQDCVIGGAGAFMVPIHSVENFVDATRTKLVREIASSAPRPTIETIADKEARISCMIGENLWRDRWRN